MPRIIVLDWEPSSHHNKHMNRNQKQTKKPVKVLLSSPVDEQMDRIARHTGVPKAVHGALAISEYAAVHDPLKTGVVAGPSNSDKTNGN